MSQRFFSAQSFNVFELDIDVWEYPKHRHNFYELIFIRSGCGIHQLNERSFDYHQGDIFLLTPHDEHSFIIEERTTFGYLKFTEQLFLEKTASLSDPSWKRKLDAVILHSNSLSGSIVSNALDRMPLFKLFQLIKKEFTNPMTHSRSILLELFGAMLMLISRNISSDSVILPLSEKDKVNAMLTYIRQNLLDPEKIRISEIAREFYMSPNYVSVFIKKHAGIAIQQYVMQTKLNMAQRLLHQTELTITQIAQKMCYTDASHFSRSFKKNTGQTPKEFRAIHV